MKDTLRQVLNTYNNENIDDFSKLLWLFQLKGKPIDLSQHHIFKPCYKSELPKRTLWKVARQLGKTTSAITLPNLLRSILIPNWTTLTVAPRFEQAKRISTDFVNPFINTSIFKDAFTSKDTRKSVLSKTFTNNSIMYFSYAYLSPDALRGIPGVDDWKIDEVQDMNDEFIPVIRSTADASPWGYETFCGTPKTLDNTIEKLWGEGTESEFIIKCKRCNKDNIPSTDYHLEAMIGKNTCICRHCGEPLDVYNGKWVARFPGKADEMVSRHLAQVVSPLHCYNEQKWKDLLYKRRTYPTSLLYNEIYGESYDTADKLFSESSLISSAKGIKYDMKTARGRSTKLKNVGMGVDWTGGGVESDSYTSIVVGGMRPGTDVVEVIYALKLPKNLDPGQEAQKVLELKEYFRAKWIAHDFGGIGRALETFLIHGGCSIKQIVPFSYVISPRRDIVYPLMMDSNKRKCFNLDKVRSIVVLASMIKMGNIILPDWESIEQYAKENQADNPFRDLLHVYTEQKESVRGSDIFYIKKTAGRSDDTTHALNLLCTTQWFSQGKYPNVQEAVNMQMTYEAAEALSPNQPNWE